MSAGERKRDYVKTTCPRDCYDACGIVAVRDDGKLRKILGDPEHHVARGGLCGKCAIVYNGTWQDPAARLTRPLRRVGPKGKAKFEPVSWETALQQISESLKPLIAAGRTSTIMQAHYTGTVGLIAGWYPLRFFSHLGATEVDPDSVCNKAGHVALEYVFGDSLEGFDPETAKQAKTILIWGANPSHSAPHMHKDWLRESGAEVIAIDPIGHKTARERASLHLQLRPGTDAALAFGFLHVAQREGLLDQAFIDAQVIGFDEILAAIEAADPVTTERRCGVPAAQIEQAAIAYAKGPSLLWLGQGMQRTARGGNAFRALAALIAGTGNLGKPGAGFCYMNGPGSRGIDMNSVVPPELDRGSGSISHMDLAETLEDSERTKVFFNWNCNPLASSPDQARLRKALMREDLFHVACDVFSTDTVAFADIVLPAAAFLEFDDVIVPYFHQTLSAQVKLQEPLGEALPNQEIFRRLAAALGFEAAALFESDADLIARILAQTPFKGGFAELAKAGTVRLYPEPRLQFAEGRYPTPSGKIEIASARAEADGLPRVPEPHADPGTTDGRLRILSPASLWQMNSSYANDPKIRKQLGGNAVLLHPDDAQAHSLTSGDRVTLSNEAGVLTLPVEVSEIAQPGMGIVYKGRWPSAEPAAANINVLHKGRKSDIGDSTTVHSMEVDLRRAEAAE
ncbi:molybdopterin-containing oxidoreductase family protein [Algihabitans albus]|uniref:molybdopterin-containing oxidoreductase family protein n=1 Tax=Algihabitans albus TaxID=2164067 RepID=UPI000E5D8B7A|nr:molybdopterin-dependent oxidoreductase [Algihabitans albus]